MSSVFPIIEPIILIKGFCLKSCDNVKKTTAHDAYPTLYEKPERITNTFLLMRYLSILYSTAVKIMVINPSGIISI